MASAAFRMTSGHDFVAGAVLLKHASIFAKPTENAGFGSPELQFSRTSRTKRSFWSSGSGSSVFGNVLHKTLVLEVRVFSFRGGRLAQNARFGAPDFQFSGTSRIKRSFWKSGSSVFEEVSHKTLVLEVRVFSLEVSQNLLVYKILMQVAQKDLTQRS